MCWIWIAFFIMSMLYHHSWVVAIVIGVCIRKKSICETHSQFIRKFGKGCCCSIRRHGVQCCCCDAADFEADRLCPMRNRQRQRGAAHNQYARKPASPRRNDYSDIILKEYSSNLAPRTFVNLTAVQQVAAVAVLYNGLPLHWRECEIELLAGETAQTDIHHEFSVAHTHLHDSSEKENTSQNVGPRVAAPEPLRAAAARPLRWSRYSFANLQEKKATNWVSNFYSSQMAKKFH